MPRPGHDPRPQPPRRIIGVTCAVLAMTCWACEGPISADAVAAISAPTDDASRSRRVVAIGDLHGDLAATHGALRLAEVISDDGHWVGGDTVVVQVGDVLDRGDDERAIIDLLIRLGEEAAAAGGALHALSGNHEVLTVAGYYEYATEGACAAFADLPLPTDPPAYVADLSPACQRRAAAFLPGGPYAKRLAQWPITLVLGDTVFVHGGLLPAHVAYGLDRINGEVSAWMRGERPVPPRAVDYTSQSLVWLRLFGEEAVPEQACAMLDQMLAEIGVTRMVIGHVIHGNINPACDDRVWRVDTGMSAHFGGDVQVIEWVDGAPHVLRQDPRPRL